MMSFIEIYTRSITISSVRYCRHKRRIIERREEIPHLSLNERDDFTIVEDVRRNERFFFIELY